VACKRYTIDSRSSQITVQAFAEGLAGIAEHRPSFFAREFSGEIEFDRDKLDGSLNLTAKAGSLEIMDEVTKHDRNAIDRVVGEVLRPELFPEVVFHSSLVVCGHIRENLYRADIAGTISLHGVENLQAIQAQLVLSDGSIRAYGKLRLRQTDYNLPLASVAGGMLRLRDELKFEFFVVARQ
jgi:YceI-like domain